MLPQTLMLNWQTELCLLNCQESIYNIFSKIVYIWAVCLYFEKNSKNQWLRWKIKFYYLSWLLQVKGEGVLEARRHVGLSGAEVTGLCEVLATIYSIRTKFSEPRAFLPLNLSLNKLPFRTSWVLMRSFLEHSSSIQRKLLYKELWSEANIFSFNVFF